uniref:FecR domain-containing protein n=1 Tax=Prevotella sp. GTC17262 TaxID=3236797 RepID=A0AB33JCB1_9BACT
MENQNTDRELIRSFFYHQFSRTLRLKFGWWLLNVSSKDLQDTEMQTLWNEADNCATPEQEEDRIKFHQQLVQQKRKETLHRYLRPTAAAVILIVATSVITYLISKNSFQQVASISEFVQITVPDKEIKTLILPDSTRVTINSGSTLIYPKEFNAKTRTIYLMGEANFDVRKNKEKPFIVQTEYLAVTALGTRFDVTSYTQQQMKTVTLEKGSVRVHSISRNLQDKAYLLNPNQKLTYDKETHQILIHQTNAAKHLSWEKGYLVFEDAKFTEITERLERRYGVHITCTNFKKMNGLYHVRFTKEENLNRILDILSELSTPFKYQITDNHITITPK